MSVIPPIVKSRHRRQERYQKSFSQRLSRIAFAILIIFSLVISAVIVSSSILFASVSNNLPSLETLPLNLEPEKKQLPDPTRLFDRSGKHLIAVLENSNARGRVYLPLQSDLQTSLPDSLISAAIASTEPDYWTNPVFSLNEILEDPQPTIAQRIIRTNLLLDQPATLQRSIIERILAAQVISQFGREKIIEWYLNSANYGNHTYGADAAARVYFGKSGAKLSLAEAALLAAAAESPSLNPVDAPIAANERKDEILKQMFVGGLISDKQLDHALDEQLTIQSSEGLTYDVAPEFTKIVVDQADEFIPTDRLFRGGLDIITSLDYELQNQIECTIESQSARITGGADQNPDEAGLEACDMARLLPSPKKGDSIPTGEFSSSVIVIDPGTGQVLSMAGSDGNGHPPGSIMTPFIYLTSFSRGASPASMVWDIPANLVEGFSNVQNPDGNFHGPVSMRKALANDYIVPALQILSQMSPDQVWHTAQQLGINNLEIPEADGAFLLPTQGGSADLLEISQAYGVFASQGSLAGIIQEVDFPQEASLPVAPQVILNIRDRSGNLLLDCTEQISECRSIKRPVITPQLAYLITDVLSDETARWPSLGHPNSLEIGRPAAAKIGITASGENAWTVGYTPDLVVSVWTGIDQPGQEIVNSHNWAAGLWHAVMQYATKDQPIEEFIPPLGISEIQVCDPSGLLPTNECPHIVDEVFTSGDEPTQLDTLFQAFLINRESGRLATIFTSPALIDEEIFMVVPPQAEGWARNANIPQVPDAYDLLDSEQIASSNTRITSPDMFSTIKNSVPIIGRAAGIGFESYRLQIGSGLNPKSWLQIVEEYFHPVSNGQLGVWDTNGLNGLFALQLIVSYEDQTVESATIQVTVDNEKPEVDILYPHNTQVFLLSDNEEITILVAASDDLELDAVEFHIDGDLVGSLEFPPYAYPWRLSSGEHTLQVKAIDRAKNVREAKVIIFVED
jgi:membrane carboxypeptidase/penicillin-binding protein